VYVDNDPSVLAQARDLLAGSTDGGGTVFVDADFHDPDRIIAEAGRVLDLTEPVAVMFMGVLGHVTDYDEMRSIVARVLAAVPSGSHLVLWDGTDTSAEQVTAADDYQDTGAVPYVVRSPAQLARCFEGLDMLEPGLVSISRWRPDPADDDIGPVDGYGAVARKP
jgi:hypothetical protein